MATIAQLVSLRLGQNSLGAARAPKSLASANAADPGCATSFRLTLSGAPQKAADAVSYTDIIKPSGDKTIDPLLAGGNRWWHTGGADGSIPSTVARHALTYSFIGNASGLNPADASGFQALDGSQQSAIRGALDYISSVVDLSFTETGSGGDIQLGSNFQASSGGYARYPGEGSQVFLANNQASFSGSWAPGSYEWETIIHEVSHALGLKHPGNYNAGGGGTPGPYLPKAQDNRGNTIMSYNDAANMKRVIYSNNSFTTSSVNPDTYQMDDIAALQYLYGAPGSTPAATYSWTRDQVFSQTIWNPNDDSVIDLSSQTRDNVVDLRAGHLSSIAMRDAYSDMPFDKLSYAKLVSGGKKLSSLLGVPTYTGQNNLAIARGSHINNAIGGSGNDTFITNGEDNVIDGGDGNDSIFVTAGDNALVGGNGDDTAYVAKATGTVWTLSDDHSTLTQTRTDKKTNITTTLATISLSGIEHVKLWNGKALKAAGTALLASPPGQSRTLAYAATPTAAPTLRTSA